MEYNKLVAVAGLPGLYELINSKTDGAIVRSLEDKTTRFVSSRIHNFSQLESIEVFTTGDNVNLATIFFAMEKNSNSLPDVKDDAAVKEYFQKTYPELDFEKVYNSDLRKMIKWFDVLKKNNIEIKLPEEPAEEPQEEIVSPPHINEEKKSSKKETVLPSSEKEKPDPKTTKKTSPSKEVKAPAKKEEPLKKKTEEKTTKKKK